MKQMPVFGWILPVILHVSFVSSAFSSTAPTFDFQSSVGDVYRGTVKEYDKYVKISPDIRIIPKTGPVCKYVVESFDDVINGTLPFTVDVTNRETGAVRVRVSRDNELDCADNVHKFYLRAQRCGDGALSQRARVEIRVDDTNNHEPEFEQSWYTVDIEENQLLDRILQVRASDKDCGHPYGEICSYEITNNAKSFSIDHLGILKNIAPLNRTVSPTQLVTIVAHDCGMRRSKPVLVTVNVKPAPKKEKSAVCRPGVSNFSSTFEYFAGQGALQLFHQANFRVCDTCRLVGDATRSVEAKISLLSSSQTKKSCDKENLSLNIQQKLCSADPDTVELLPRSTSIKLENEPDKNDNEVFESADEVYVFDGRENAVIVQESVFKPVLSNVFTLAFWMKHKNSTETRKNKKENIVCLSDDHAMSRHHFAVYLKHCKLEVLLRREKLKSDKKSHATKATSEKYEPAEWRWEIPEVCDDQWHHYTLNFRFPQMDLMVDGSNTAAKDELPEILDDYPMHLHKQLKNRLVIGACWHGRSSKMVQHFNGYLSSITMLTNKLEKQSTLECLTQCKEQLEFFGLDSLKPGEEAVFNKDMSELTLKAANVKDFVAMLRKVAFVNSRANPTIGERIVRVVPTVTCDENNPSSLLPVVETQIFLKNVEPVDLVLKSSHNVLYHNRHEVRDQGIILYPDVQLNVVGDHLKEWTLDYCTIKSVPKFDKSREYFSSNANLIGKFSNMDFEHVKNGLILKGRQNVKIYEEILRQIRYFSSNPAEFKTRIFKLQCSMYGNRLPSNEFVLTLHIDKDDDVTTSTAAGAVPTKKDITSSSTGHLDRRENYLVDNDVGHLSVHKMEMQAPEPKLSFASPMGHDSIGYDSFGPALQTGPGGAVAVVVVVCVGFLLLLVVMGILKIRSTNQNLQKSRRRSRRLSSTAGGAAVAGDLTWDDSGMNIIVNPIEHVSTEDETKNCPADGAESEMSSDEESYHDEEDDFSDDDDEDDRVLPHLESNKRASVSTKANSNLEWDDSTSPDSYKV